MGYGAAYTGLPTIGNRLFQGCHREQSACKKMILLSWLCSRHDFGRNESLHVEDIFGGGSNMAGRVFGSLFGGVMSEMLQAMQVRVMVCSTQYALVLHTIIDYRL